jgi:hypothetical protein
MDKQSWILAEQAGTEEPLDLEVYELEELDDRSLAVVSVHGPLCSSSCCCC